MKTAFVIFLFIYAIQNKCCEAKQLNTKHNLLRDSTLTMRSMDTLSITQIGVNKPLGNAIRFWGSVPHQANTWFIYTCPIKNETNDTVKLSILCNAGDCFPVNSFYELAPNTLINLDVKFLRLAHIRYREITIDIKSIHIQTKFPLLIKYDGGD